MTRISTNQIIGLGEVSSVVEPDTMLFWLVLMREVSRVVVRCWEKWMLCSGWAFWGRSVEWFVRGVEG